MKAVILIICCLLLWDAEGGGGRQGRKGKDGAYPGTRSSGSGSGSGDFRKRRKRGKRERSSDGVAPLEMIPNLDLYIGPEQGADARVKYREDIVQGAKVTYNIITDAVLMKKPLLVGKMGNTEYNQISRWYNAEKGARWYSVDITLCRFAGVCPATIGTINNFATVFIDTVREIDLHFRWHLSMHVDHKVDSILFPKNQVVLPNIMSLDPWFFTKAYSESFAGKTVLVVSNHAAFIRQQYEQNRTCIFKGRNDILPPFVLKTIATPLPPNPADSSLLLNDTTYIWPTWQETLESIKLKVLQQGHYDIMLIAAGSFSIPVAAEAKHNGKVAIHLGGTMNPFFGLYSGRYDSRLYYKKLIYTDCFMRMPKPVEAKHIENSAYW